MSLLVVPSLLTAGILQFAMVSAAAGDAQTERRHIHAETLSPQDTPILLPDGSVVSYDVKPIRQPTPMSCWAAVFTMMRSWRESRVLAIADAVADLGPPYPLYLTKDEGLPGGMEQEFVKRAGMRVLPPASYPLSYIRNLLRERGPLWITAGDGITAHARLLIGIYSVDERETAQNYEKSWMKFIDPEDGTFRYQTAMEFERIFEQEAAFIVHGGSDNIPLRWQIITF